MSPLYIQYPIRPHTDIKPMAPLEAFFSYALDITFEVNILKI